MDKETLVSLEVSRRREKHQKLGENQQKQMEYRRVNTDSKNFHQSVSATNDRYMIDALTKVRKSDVTLPEDLTRMNGTWMRNQSSK
jgi:CRISPR/Cas system-associated protein Cas10 (large subunit of type III CRISPR-Cas system)